MSEHEYVFKVQRPNEPLFNPIKKNYYFYQIAYYAKKDQITNKSVNEIRKIIFDEYNNIIGIKNYKCAKYKFGEIIEKLNKGRYKIYPVASLKNVEITNELFHLASSELLD